MPGTMGARGPPPPLSIPSFHHQSGGGATSDSFRTRGRNRSGGSSGASSREHSVEGRGGHGGSGGAEFRASYHAQYQAPPKRGGDARMPNGNSWNEPRGRQQMGGGAQNWVLAPEEGGGGNPNHWRSNNREAILHGRVQGVFPDVDGPAGNRGYPGLNLGAQGRGYGVPPPQRPEGNGFGGFYERHGNNGYGVPQRQENNTYGGHQRQENSGYGVFQREEMNGYGGFDRQDGKGWQDNKGYGAGVPPVHDVRWRAPEARGYPRTCQSGGFSRGGGGRPYVDVRNAQRIVPPKEDVFGESKELQTFGSPRGLSRTKLVSPKGEAIGHWARPGDVPGSRDGEKVTSENSIAPQIETRQGEKLQGLTKKGEEEASSYRILIPSSSSWKGSSSTHQSNKNSFERERLGSGKRDSGEVLVPSPSSSSSSKGGGSMSRRNSLERKKSSELPIFIPSSSAKVETKLENSFEKISREKVSVDAEALQDPVLKGDGGSKTLPQVQGKEVVESAKAGMHKSRVTDWYEICLKEEEEEELQLARARKLEEESIPVIEDPTFSGYRGSRSEESSLFRPNSSPSNGEIKDSTFGRGLRDRSLVRGDVTDAAQQRSTDPSGGGSSSSEGFFTPWNSLQPVSNGNLGPSSASRSKSLLHQFDKSYGESKNGVSIAGGRQAGRRIVNAVNTDEPGDWRQSRRPASGDDSREWSRPETSREPMFAGARGNDALERKGLLGSGDLRESIRLESMRDSMTGGPVGRRVISAVDDGAENWRQPRRTVASSGEDPREAVRSEIPRESIASRSRGNGMMEGRGLLGSGDSKESGRPESFWDSAGRPTGRSAVEFESAKNWRRPIKPSGGESRQDVRFESLQDSVAGRTRAKEVMEGKGLLGSGDSKESVRQDTQRRVTSVIDTDGAENWRSQRRPTSASGDDSSEATRPEMRESIVSKSRGKGAMEGKGLLGSGDSKDILRLENLRDPGGRPAGRRPFNAIDIGGVENWRRPTMAPGHDSKEAMRPGSLRDSITDGAAGRRVINATDTGDSWRRTSNATDFGGVENWRRPTTVSRDESKEAVRPRSARDSIADGSAGRRVLNVIDTGDSESWRSHRRTISGGSILGASPESLWDSGASLSGSAAVKETILVQGLEAETVEDKNVAQKMSMPARPSASFYHAYNIPATEEDESLPHIVGTCPDMCPVRERLQRERLRDLAVFERVSGDMRKTSKELAVKKFCRTVVSSELEQSDVRPLPVLWRTLQYLLGLLDDPEFSVDIVHNFLFDRTRAIRQELGMQRILDHQAVTIHEEIVRFHILSQHELREQNTKRSKQVDTHLNLEQLSKSLHTLLNLYTSLGRDGGVHFKNEEEFHAYYVLLNLGDHGRFQAEPLSLWFPNVRPRVLKGAPIIFARKVLRLYRNSSYIGFFKSVRESTYLQSCLLELNFDSMRATALAMLNVAEYKLHPFPLADLARQLILEEGEVEKLCMYYGLLTGVENTTQKPCLLVKQAQFAIPEKESLPQFSCPLIDSKRAPSFFLEVKGVSKDI